MVPKHLTHPNGRLLQKNHSPGTDSELLGTTNIVINQCLLAHGKFILEILLVLFNHRRYHTASDLAQIIPSSKFYMILNEEAKIWVPNLANKMQLLL